MVVVQQFSQHLLSCPGLCVLERLREAGSRTGGGHTLEEETGNRKSLRTWLSAPTELFVGPWEGETGRPGARPGPGEVTEMASWKM